MVIIKLSIKINKYTLIIYFYGFGDKIKPVEEKFALV